MARKQNPKQLARAVWLEKLKNGDVLPIRGGLPWSLIDPEFKQYAAEYIRLREVLKTALLKTRAP